MSAPLRLTRDVVLGGDFRILAPLGAGGMGAVYTAEQLSTGKLRALKVMNPLLVDDAKQRQRFAQEARIGARVVSDHVVDVIAAGVDDELGMPWIAMELLDGDDLGEHVTKHGPQQVSQVVEVFRQLCHALGAAHRAGVVHRDVKPQNVFISTTQTTSTPAAVKVLDFGIAKVAAVASATGTAMVGSPAWMAPEQTDPQATISPAADVWALGLLAFWMLTGMSYWQAANSSKASMHALMKEVLFDDLLPASERAAEYQRAARLPAGFDRWFARCVAREPKARFGDAAELYAAFEELAGDGAPTDLAGGRPSPGLTVADVGVMSTRQVFDSAELAAEPDGAAALSTRSFVESSDLDVAVSEPGQDGPELAAVDEALAKAAATGELAYAGTLDASTASLAGQRATGAPPAGAAPGSKAARYGVGALALIAVAAAALVAGMGLADRRSSAQPVRGSAAAPVAVATGSVPAAATAAPATATHAQPAAGISIPGMTPVAHADRFDVTAGFVAARKVAREEAPDAELTWFAARRVTDGGLIDLPRGGTASYMFYSAATKYCLTVTYSGLGRYVGESPAQSCQRRIVGTPKCPVAEVMGRAKTSLEIVGNPPTMISFGWLRDQGRVGWFVKQGGLERSDLLDDCAPPAKTPSRRGAGSRVSP